MTRMDYGKGLLFLLLLATLPIILLVVALLASYGVWGALGLLAFFGGLGFGYQFFRSIAYNRGKAIQYVIWSFLGLALVFGLDYFFFSTSNFFLKCSIGYFIVCFALNLLFVYSLAFKLLLVNDKNFSLKWFKMPMNIQVTQRFLETASRKKQYGVVSQLLGHIFYHIDHLENPKDWSELFFKHLDANEQALFVTYGYFYANDHYDYQKLLRPLQTIAFFETWVGYLETNPTAQNLYKTYLDCFNNVLKEYIKTPIDYPHLHGVLNSKPNLDFVDKLQEYTITNTNLKDETVVLSNYLFMAIKIAEQFKAPQR